MSKVYFIAGANRGIGFHLTETIAALRDVSIIATTRSRAKSTELVTLAENSGNISIIELDVASDESIANLDNELKVLAPTGVDYFIHNSGIMEKSVYTPVLSATKDTWLKHYTVNTLGPIFVTAKLYPYLKMRDTKVVYIVSSSVGSMGDFLGMTNSAYGQGKAALNHSIRTMAMELGPEGFTVVAVHPGLVNSDLGKTAYEVFAKVDRDRADWMKDNWMIEPEVSAAKQLELLKGLTEDDNGKFFDYDGKIHAW